MVELKRSVSVDDLGAHLRSAGNGQQLLQIVRIVPAECTCFSGVDSDVPVTDLLRSLLFDCTLPEAGSAGDA